MVFLAARSDASMHESGLSSGVAAEVFLFVDHQHFRLLHKASYHFPVHSIETAEFLGVLLSAQLLSDPSTLAKAGKAAEIMEAPAQVTEALLHTDRVGLLDVCQRCPVFQWLHQRCVELYRLDRDDVRVQWLQRGDPWMAPVDREARSVRKAPVTPVEFSTLGTVVVRNPILYRDLYRMAVKWRAQQPIPTPVRTHDTYPLCGGATGPNRDQRSLHESVPTSVEQPEMD